VEHIAAADDPGGLRGWGSEVDRLGAGGGRQHLEQVGQAEGDQDAGHRYGQGDGADLLGDAGGVEVQRARGGDQHQHERDRAGVLHRPGVGGDAVQGFAVQGLELLGVAAQVGYR
jgi:hypothetical protein